MKRRFWALILLALFSLGLFSEGLAIRPESQGSKLQTTEKLVHSQAAQLTILANYPKVAAAFQAASGTSSQKLTPIPGLYQAETLDLRNHQLANCKQMTPQGIAVSQAYFFISAYCHEHRHNSVVYQIERQTNQLSKTIVLKGDPHAGGVVYDEKNQQLYVASKAVSTGAVSIITLDKIEKYDIKERRPITYREEANLLGVPRASLLASLPRFLLVGYFDLARNGKLVLYPIDKNGELQRPKTPSRKITGSLPVQAEAAGAIDILPKVQGIALYQDFMLMSQSFGNHNSMLYVFDVRKVNSDFSINQAVMAIPFPPYLEQITVDGDQLLALFESGSAPYRKRTTKHVDRVLHLDLKTLLKK